MDSSTPRSRLEQKLETGVRIVGRWLALGEGAVLLAVAAVLLLAGLLVVMDTVDELLRAVAHRRIVEAIFSIAENALLALIAAVLVHTLLLQVHGHALTPEPFIVIAIVAILRKMLLTPKASEVSMLVTPVTAELIALGVLTLVLGGALALLRRYGRSNP